MALVAPVPPIGVVENEAVGEKLYTRKFIVVVVYRYIPVVGVTRFVLIRICGCP